MSGRAADILGIASGPLPRGTPKQVSEKLAFGKSAATTPSSRPV